MKSRKYLISLCLASFSALTAEEGSFFDKTGAVGFRITENTVHSATASNALTLGSNSSQWAVATGNYSITLPSPTTFRGKGVEWETSVRHTGLFRSNYLLSYSALGSEHIQSPAYSSSQSGGTVLSPGTPTLLQDFTVWDYSKNKLDSMRASWGGDFLIFNGFKNKYLENFALRFGLEAYQNQTRLVSGSNMYYDSLTIAKNPPFSGGGVDPVTRDRIDYREFFGSAVAGLNYAIALGNGRIDVGVEYFSSFYGDNRFDDHSRTLATIGSKLLPLNGHVKITSQGKIEGNRFQLGYLWNFNESLFVRFSGAVSSATHSTSHGLSTLDPMLFAVNFMAGNFISSVGTKTSARDTRSQIGIEFGFRY
ncbi:hypothetical protein EHO60_01855 [Leptospira fletcheri]|uniref:DUF481 domain-containing protein n=1 Tax=Leptospira fletcheri TaxID=2484981 RepID=A0A4R9GK34_9LEPT|nr:hypothetical protein [Leptospira fletcheri]TGK14112.1 hypothetical protein EHO60_01855 [Leptospira fletcheri]